MLVICLCYSIPLITVGVIGTSLMQFWYAELHFPLWVSILIGFGITLVATVWFSLMQGKTLMEVAVGSLILLLLFLFLWPPLMRKREQNLRSRTKTTHLVPLRVTDRVE